MERGVVDPGAGGSTRRHPPGVEPAIIVHRTIVDGQWICAVTECGDSVQHTDEVRQQRSHVHTHAGCRTTDSLRRDVGDDSPSRGNGAVEDAPGIDEVSLAGA